MFVFGGFESCHLSLHTLICKFWSWKFAVFGKIKHKVECFCIFKAHEHQLSFFFVRNLLFGGLSQNVFCIFFVKLWQALCFSHFFVRILYLANIFWTWKKKVKIVFLSKAFSIGLFLFFFYDTLLMFFLLRKKRLDWFTKTFLSEHKKKKCFKKKVFRLLNQSCFVLLDMCLQKLVDNTANKKVFSFLGLVFGHRE